MENNIKPDVTVIAPVLNVAKYLNASISSMLAQTHKNIEIILVDGGSTDGSSELCDKFALESPNVQVIHAKCECVGEARNLGLDAARGEYIYFCDPDDIIDPKLIEDNYGLAKEHDADIVEFGYRYVAYDADGNAVSQPVEPEMPNLGGEYTSGEFWNRFNEEFKQIESLWVRLYRADFIRRHSLRLKPYLRMEDCVFVYEAFSKPFNKIVYNPKRYYTYVRRPGSATKVFKSKMLEDTYAALEEYEAILMSSPADKQTVKMSVAKKFCDCATWHASDLVLQSRLSDREIIAMLKNYLERPGFKRAFEVMKHSNEYGGSRKIAVRLLMNGKYRTYLLMRRLIKK